MGTASEKNPETQRLENESLRLTFEEGGGQLTGIYDKENDRELLWEGDPKFWSYHAPVLFPFVGKMFGGVYRYDGKEYEIGQHGFARTSVFRPAGRREDSISWELADSDASRQIYPFAFQFDVVHILKGREITVRWIVRNPSDSETLYFSVGAHPAFRVPVREGEKKDQYWLDFHGLNRIPYMTPDKATGTINNRESFELETEDGYLKIRDHLFDIDTYVFRNQTIKEISLCTPDKKPYVTVSCAGFPDFGIWSKSDEAPFVCLEPWYGSADNLGFEGELPDKYGILSLEAGKEFTAEYRILIHA